jgi:hypothetical protein
LCAGNPCSFTFASIAGVANAGAATATMADVTTLSRTTRMPISFPRAPRPAMRDEPSGQIVRNDEADAGRDDQA